MLFKIKFNTHTTNIVYIQPGTTLDKSLYEKVANALNVDVSCFGEEEWYSAHKSASPFFIYVNNQNRPEFENLYFDKDKEVKKDGFRLIEERYLQLMQKDINVNIINYEHL